MMELEVGGQRTSIPVGEMVIGTDPSCGLRLAGLAAAHAVVIGLPDGSVAVRRVGENEVYLNGVRLGAEPAPVLHGDKIQVGNHELFVHDPRRSGSTQFVSAGDVARMVAATSKPAGGPKPPTAATGGRLVCLTDGREYTIGSTPLVIGREAGCDIVVPNKDVSRRHAEIFASPQGYVLVDSSTNGTFVNAERVEAQRVLARADVIRIGDHEFRFYADRIPDVPSLVNAPPLAPQPAPAPPAPPVFAPMPPGPPAPAAGAAERLSYTMHGVPSPSPAPAPAPPPPAPRASTPPRPAGGPPPLATFLVRSGQLKGQRLTVRVPVVNIGRAEYNDLVLPDDSVSGAHAKLQRREGIWVLIDNDSTNGTWVDGERVSGETMLGPGAVVRFGEISAMFEPTDDHLGTAAGSGTKVMGAMRPPAPPPVAPAPARPVSSPGMPPLQEPVYPNPATPSPARPSMEAPVFPSEQPLSRPVARRPVVMTGPEPRGMPKWVIPLVVVVILGVVAAILLTR
jgi:pSer/pThr/pTyr-binding forkhead associated (FHA) protein